jgi:regulator of protease activity HflC (stomatin/prohibitin superfamily)
MNALNRLHDIVIPQGHVGLLYEDGRYARTLEPGKHELKKKLFDKTERSVDLVDVRDRSLVIKGQEILTKDKVAIRVSLLVYFRVTDAVAASHKVAEYEARIYEDVQLAARRFLAGRELEAILSDRNEISDAVRHAVGESARGYGVEILRADVKDLVFPGNLREIMNQVLETERRAEARLIQAKKEIETARIQAEADLAAQRLALEKQAEAARARLENELAEARAVRDQPELLALRELEVLRDMAARGARFVVGTSRGLSGALVEKQIEE